MKREFNEVEYKCTNCTNTQTIRYFLDDDNPLQATCCVKCRTGFGMELREMVMQHKGMFPVKQRSVA